MLLLAPVIFFLFIYATFDKSDYTSYIETAFLDATGLLLSIEGDSSLDFSQTLKLHAEKVVIKTPEQINLVTADTLSAKINFENLIKGHWQIDEVLLSQVNLNLEKNEQGDFSFATMNSGTIHQGTIHQATIHQNQANPETNPKISNKDVLLSELPFKKLTLKDSSLNYIDHSSDLGFTFNNLNVSLQENNDLAVAELSFDYELKKGQRGKIDAYAELEFGEQLTIKNLKNKIILKHGDINYDLTVSGELMSNLSFSEIKSEKLTLESDSFKLQSDIKFNHLPHKTTLNLDLKAFNTIPVLQWITTKPVNINSQDLLKISNSELKVIYENQKVSLDIAAMQLGDTKLVGEISYQSGQSGSVYSKIKLDQLQLDQYVGLQSLILANDANDDSQPQPDSEINYDISLQINRLMFEDALIEPFIKRTVFDGETWSSEGQINAVNLKPFKLATNFSFISDDIQKKVESFEKIEGTLKYQVNANRLMFSDVDMTINETSIVGDFDYQHRKRTVSSNLTIGELNLDKYQSFFKENDPGQEESESNPLAVVIEELKSFNGEGDIRINKLTYQGVEYQGINIQFSDS